MFSLSEMPSSTSILSAYASIAGSMMLFRSMADQFLPPQLQSYISTTLSRLLFKPHPENLTLIIEELDGYSRNQVYEASEIYLRTIITPDVDRLRVTQAPREKKLSLKIDQGQEVNDVFQGVCLTWRIVSSAPQKTSNGEGDGRYGASTNRPEQRFFEISFQKKHKDLIVGSYLPYIMKKSEELKEDIKVLKLYSLGLGSYCGDMGNGAWGSINLEHPSTFDTLAMDPTMKELLMEDLDRFVRRREFYKRVGKAWKRGYLLYGPPGTGKSSLIAAMANYLNFDIYDLELANLRSNSDLRSLLITTTNRSILVIEDIDCSTVELEDRDAYDVGYHAPDTKLPLSGLLNFVDGLWSSCGDERIIIFTTNHKDRLDPALLRPGRMDMHINMSYCTVEGFKLLASNYLSVDGHHRHLGEIEDLIRESHITPAEVAEELMKDDDADAALGGLINFLKRKNMSSSNEDDETAKRLKIEKGDEPKPRRNNIRMGRYRGGYRGRGSRRLW